MAGRAKRMRQYYAAILNGLLEDTPVSTDVPFQDLSTEFKSLLFYGSGDRAITVQASAERKISKPFEGLVAQMQRLYETSESEFTGNACAIPRSASLRNVPGCTTPSGGVRRDNLRCGRTPIQYQPVLRLSNLGGWEALTTCGAHRRQRR